PDLSVLLCKLETAYGFETGLELRRVLFRSIDALHDRGYRTGMFGKWHLGEHGVSRPRGFDAWKIFPGQGDYIDPEMIDEYGSHKLGRASCRERGDGQLAHGPVLAAPAGQRR